MTDPLLRDRVVAAIGDRYDVVRELGRGALSVVYLGRDVRLDRPVAIKVLPPDVAFRPEVRARFLREAQTAARLAHPHVVPIYSVDDTAGVVSIVMAHVEGETLGGRLAREGPLPAADVARILREVADALGYAHAQGVIHRDVKPDNILLERGTGRALVTDFGIARAMEGGDQVTATGVAVGTPAYMSPEQAMGERALDGRSDVYALGILGWQMLVGALPFQAASTPAMLLKHVGEPVPSAAARRPDAPPALVAIVERALAKKPDDRWPGARAMRDALAALGQDGGAGTAAAAPAPASPAALPEAAADALPRFPQYPVGGDRAARDAWRDATRAWREEVRARAEASAALRIGAGVRAELRAEMRMAPSPVPWRPDDPAAIAWRVRRFRGSAWSYVFTISGLAAVNLLTGPMFLWVAFPAFFWGMAVIRQAAALRGLGVSATDAFLGRDAKARQSLEAEIVAGGEAAVERRVTRFRRALATTAALAVGTIAALAVGVAAKGGVFAVVGVLGVGATVVSGIGTIRRWVDVRALGLRFAAAARGDWRAAFRRGNPALANEVMHADAQRKLPPDVLGGPYGEAVRRAAHDRATILETVAKLGEADRQLLPDILPTVQHLEERILSVATALHRMSGDVSEAHVADVERRLADAKAAQAAAPAPERDRTVGLLARQVETLRDLVGRRATLQDQLEGAALLLTTLKLDLLRLRSAGVESAVQDVTSATQEARALSRDIGLALDVAGELRRIS
ncbi:MAG: protein kinase domain-containing protein [Gemmatimonadota bacterium]|jgi:hypothetical protein|nr:protein kinase [Gemmatimonadota bacterium]